MNLPNHNTTADAGVHTPGPWRVDPDANCDIQNVDGSLEIASTHPSVINGGPTDPGKARANARLIAAAPELLDALENFRLAAEYWAGCDEGCDTDTASSEIMSSGGAWPAEAYDKAVAAIAKATNK